MRDDETAIAVGHVDVHKAWRVQVGRRWRAHAGRACGRQGRRRWRARTRRTDQDDELQRLRARDAIVQDDRAAEGAALVHNLREAHGGAARLWQHDLRTPARWQRRTRVIEQRRAEQRARRQPGQRRAGAGAAAHRTAPSTQLVDDEQPHCGRRYLCTGRALVRHAPTQGAGTSAADQSAAGAGAAAAAATAARAALEKEHVAGLIVDRDAVDGAECHVGRLRREHACKHVAYGHIGDGHRAEAKHRRPVVERE